VICPIVKIFRQGKESLVGLCTKEKKARRHMKKNQSVGRNENVGVWVCLESSIFPKGHSLSFSQPKSLLSLLCNRSVMRLRAWWTQSRRPSMKMNLPAYNLPMYSLSLRRPSLGESLTIPNHTHNSTSTSTFSFLPSKKGCGARTMVSLSVGIDQILHNLELR